MRNISVGEQTRLIKTVISSFVYIAASYIRINSHWYSIPSPHSSEMNIDETLLFDIVYGMSFRNFALWATLHAVYVRMKFNTYLHKQEMYQISGIESLSIDQFSRSKMWTRGSMSGVALPTRRPLWVFTAGGLSMCLSTLVRGCQLWKGNIISKANIF